MSYILIPQIVSDTTAMIWVGAVDEKKIRTTKVFLKYKITDPPGTPKDQLHPVSSIELSPSEWRTWKTRHPLEKIEKKGFVQFIHYQRVTIGSKIPLTPRTKYTVTLIIEDSNPTPTGENVTIDKGRFRDYNQIPTDVTKPVETTEHLTKATVTTLPESVPLKDKPFKIMLGSCFYLPEDKEGLVGRTFYNLPENEQPEIKFLCGDQVYLDNPWQETTWNLAASFSPKENMRALFFKKYLDTWTHIKNDENDQTKAVGGFNLLLSHGANYFCSDDHEFWNNGPNFGGVGAALTALRSQRRWWFREASDLFRVFQSLAPWMTFDVKPLSFCIADTRINRSTHKLIGLDEDAVFMEPDDLLAVGEWIKNLQGPGVLVLGQLLMTDGANWRKTFQNLSGFSIFTRLKETFGDYFDFGLPDFPSQYNELCGYIRNSKHSIVLLSGDVHFGRVAVCNLSEDGQTKFVEVISSPMSVVRVNKKITGIGTYEPAPEFFGLEVESVPIALSNDPKPLSQSHFTTIEFSRNSLTDAEIEMKVKSWNILTKDQTTPSSVEIKTITLK